MQKCTNARWRRLAPVFVIALLVLAFVHSAFLHSQDQPRPTFKTEANYVRVDVFPTKDGQPVLDLTADDFEVLEDKVPQKVDAFQHIVVRGNVPQDVRREPNNTRESRAMMEDPNTRVFVLFLDTYHVEAGASRSIQKPLIDALDKMIGADDLVGVMTPEMSAGDVAFARKTTTIEGFLTRNWPWGERERLNSVDPIEDQYRACYPGTAAPPGCPADQNDKGIYAAMIDRRREKRTLDALEDLVRFLHGVREERKAVLAISDGWTLFRPDASLARQIMCQTPSGPDVRVDPRTGKLSTRAPENALGTDASVCERDRQQLAQIDDERQFRDILDEANRANTSFYPIDPRGLVVFDTPLVPVNGPSMMSAAPMIPIGTDQAMLRARLDSLRTLAEATDGVAIVDNNNLAGGFKRIVDDLSSYYLLGYYSTGKLDGKFHSITVRVKRPGVQVRARRGFLAASANDAGRKTSAPASPEAAAAAVEAHAIEAVVAPLENYTREVPLRLLAASGWNTASPSSAAVWLVGEVSRGSASRDDWSQGGEADITMTTADGATVATARAPIASGARWFRAVLTSTAAPISAGDYMVRVTLRSSSAGAIPTRDTVRVVVVSSPSATGALVFRRGQSTGNRDVPTADLRFHRSEHIKVEVPARDASAITARLLDRSGKPLPLPVTAAVRDDPDGSHWDTAQLTLAPLGVGDYVIEIMEGAGGAGRSGGAGGSGGERRLVGFRVVP
jgi:VWFA-related protein